VSAESCRRFIRLRALRRVWAHGRGGYRPGGQIGVYAQVAFFAAVLPQFADRQAGHVPAQMLLLGAVFMAIAVLCDSGWALAAGTARAWFARSPRRLELAAGAGGLLMIGIGASLAIAGRHD